MIGRGRGSGRGTFRGRGGVIPRTGLTSRAYYSTAQYHTLEAKHTKLQKESENVALDVAMTEQRLNNQINRLHGEKEEIQAELEARRSEIETQKNLIEEQKKEIENLLIHVEAKRELLESYNQVWRQELVILRSQIEEQERTTRVLEEEKLHDKLEDEIAWATYRQQRKDVETVLQREIHTQEETFRSLQSQQDHLQIRFDELSHTHQETFEALQKKTQEYTKEKTKSTILEEQNASLSTQANALVQKLEATQSNLRDVTQRYEDLHVELKASQSHVETLKKRSKTLEKSMRETSTRLGTTQGNLSEISEREAQKDLLLLQGEQARRKLLVQIEEIKGNIRVYCRVRPPLCEKKEAHFNFPDLLDYQVLEIRQLRENATSTSRVEKTNHFKYDVVFRPQTTQEDIFERVCPLVESTVDGYKVCIFAYGQTGSGKTYTMQGTPQNPGIISRSFEKIFDATQHLIAHFRWTFILSFTFVEIYNEVIRDLLIDSEDYRKAIIDSEEIKHEIRHENHQETQITGVKVVTVTTPYQLEELLVTAMKNRTTARTRLNERSSRSHSIFTLKIEGENQHMGRKTSGVLCLIDLAGSERVAESGSQGQQLKEAMQINRSLSHLGDVILALSQKDKNTSPEGATEGGSTLHVPYRNSKLTFLLQNYLGGKGSKVLMFVHVSPLEEHLAESISSLRFASKVNATSIGPARRRSITNDGGMESRRVGWGL